MYLQPYQLLWSQPLFAINATSSLSAARLGVLGLELCWAVTAMAVCNRNMPCGKFWDDALPNLEDQNNQKDSEEQPNLMTSSSQHTVNQSLACTKSLCIAGFLHGYCASTALRDQNAPRK